ncbi:MAG: hypothetical protein PHS95_00790 [Candidatus Pacebacteria bacterium]|nr:hypothetical protein [Candidatus Paceibacterota bacterium]
MKKLCTFLFLAFATIPFFVFAQGLPIDASSSGSLVLQSVPAAPLPKEMVTVVLSGPGINLRDATITWSINDKVVGMGVGKTTFSFKNGGSEETTDIVASVLLNTGEVLSKKISFTPAGFSLLWEASTYTPPFYKGKATMTPEANMRVLVVPDNSSTADRIDPSTLMYTWRKDGTTLPDNSDYGKNSFSFTAPKLGYPADIQVQLVSPDSTIDQGYGIKLSPGVPFVLLYEDVPLLGVWYNNAFGNTVTLDRKEFSISAEPYFFPSETGLTPNVTYSWALDGKLLQEASRFITFRNETEEKVDSKLNLSVQSKNKGSQTATRSLVIRSADIQSSGSFMY